MTKRDDETTDQAPEAGDSTATTEESTLGSEQQDDGAKTDEPLQDGEEPRASSSNDSAEDIAGGNELSDEPSPAGDERVHSDHAASKATARRRKKKKAPEPKSNAGLLIAAALIAGLAGGWLARDARAQTLLTGPEKDAALCGDWQSKICGEFGDDAFACTEAKSAAELLPPAACDEALSAIPETFDKVREARASCDQLVNKLCADLGEQTQTCEMVRDKTKQFPPDRCDQMMESYDQVIGQLKMLEQRQAMTGGPPGGAAQPPMRAMPSQPPQQSTPQPEKAE